MEHERPVGICQYRHIRTDYRVVLHLHSVVGEKSTVVRGRPLVMGSTSVYLRGPDIPCKLCSFLIFASESGGDIFLRGAPNGRSSGSVRGQHGGMSTVAHADRDPDSDIARLLAAQRRSRAALADTVGFISGLPVGWW